ncbi:hypothetical protein TRFO_23523 [Tritrichomonas foetus]|uniref:F5/8 type C domain-containing protein n=1 Tax=Tritrichomonas foetus TaxID=1144522 RepID=A0A1J4KB07_9EUKA|nr:hypothetical protein TRFO_23523 [Tritrichomonas foetus]|eukprot:OHT08080.1 hypothetical protein TRFO_23523 [Tritrichomonas foetus]
MNSIELSLFDERLILGMMNENHAENELFLSSKGLKNIIFDEELNEQNGFTFIVNNNMYQTTKIFADFISPIISKVHQIDRIYDTFEINVPFDDAFSEFINLSIGKKMTINNKNYHFIKYVSEKLGNEELHEYFQENKHVELTIDNVFDVLTIKKMNKVSYNDEISFLASHFFEIDEKKVAELSYDDINSILVHPNLRTQSEDSLFDFVNELATQNSHYFGLFENIEFCYLSNSKIRVFLDNSNVENMNSGVWKAISKRLLLTKENLLQRTYYKKSISIKFNENEPLNGVFSYLTNLYKTKIARNHIINVIPSSCNGKEPEEIVDSPTPIVFQTDDKPNSWLAFDFNNFKLCPTSYSLQSYYLGKPGFSNPRNWILEGSNDGRYWSTIDTEEDNAVLNGKNVVKNFIVNCDESFKLFRIRQTGKNWAGKDQLTLSKVEFFGELFQI